MENIALDFRDAKGKLESNHVSIEKEKKSLEARR